jgi:hypothetical protein
MGPIGCGARLQLLYWAQGVLIIFTSCHSEGTNPSANHVGEIVSLRAFARYK